MKFALAIVCVLLQCALGDYPPPDYLFTTTTIKPGPTFLPKDPEQVIESFNVQTDIRFRFATTRMVTIVRNTAGAAKEMAFDVTLPKEAFIVSFAMTIDGKVYDGEVKEKKAAKEQYDRAVSRGQSAGHIRQAPRHSNRFEVSVNVEDGKAVNFTLIYQELLKRNLGMYEYEMHVHPGQAVQDFNVEVYIQENRPLSFVKTPALRKGSVTTNKIEASNDLTTIDLPTSTTAHIRYKPTVAQQGNGGLSARFVVQYDVEHSDEGDLLVVDGFFLHLFSPKPTDFLPKDIIFVLDNSGSMSGTKIAQLKQAMVAILGDLNEEDRFNILPFSSNVDKWKSHLVKATADAIETANDFVKGMNAVGGTNINNALLSALEELQQREVKSRVGMVFFLTDGEATSGETSTSKIAANVMGKNTGGAAIFSLAFGNGANFDSLKTISTQNSGFARKIYEASDAALQVETLYKEISIVSMKNVSVEYLPGITKTTDTDFPVVFNGTEIVICGLLPPMLPRFEARMSGLEKGGEIDLVLEIDDVEEVTITADDSINPFFSMPRDYTGIVEKMWAFLTIKQMLKEKQRVSEYRTKVEQLDKKILEMSLKYKFVTPLTSMVVTKPETEGNDKQVEEESGLEDNDDPEPPTSVSYRRKGGRQYFRKKSYRGQTSHRLAPDAMGLAYDLGYGGVVQSGHGGLSSKTRMHSALLPRPTFIPRGTSLPSQSIPWFTSTARPRLTFAPTKVTGKLKGWKRGKNKGKQAKIGILSSIVFRNDQRSVCLAPKKLSSGKYVVYEAGNDVKIVLQTGCFKRCRVVVPDQLFLTSNGKTALVNLTMLSSWQVSQHQDFSVSFSKGKMVLEHSDMTLTIARQVKKKKMIYSMEIVNKSQKATSGMIEMLTPRKMKGRKARKQRKTPRGCKKESVDMSMVFNKKKARKFMA